MKSEALVIIAPNQLDLLPVEVPEPGPAQVLVAAAYSCISPGTEARVLSGVQVGMPPFPVVPGYSAAGIVEKTGPASIWEKGRQVFYSRASCADYSICWGAHQRHAVLADGALTAIPPGLDLRVASSAKLVAIAEHGQRLAEVRKGDNVAVMGLGPIGFYAAMCARSREATVTVSDLRMVRQDLARKLGFEILPTDPKEKRQRFDVVVDATGAPSALPAAIELLREKPWDDARHPMTRLLIQGSYSQAPLLPYNELFVKEPIVFIPRDNQRSDIVAALKMMVDHKLPFLELLQDFGSPANATSAYGAVAGGEVITGYFTW